MKIEYGSFKHKLFIAMMLAGEYPYKSLDLMRESYATKLPVLKELRDSDYITVTEAYNEKRIRFKMYEKKKKEYAHQLFDGGELYKPDIRSNGQRKLDRKDRIAEIVVMMLEAGINVTPDMKPDADDAGPLLENSELLPYYITSLEARAAITIKEDKGKGARFHGTLVSNGGVYNIYNMGDKMMGWVRPSEKTAVDFNEEYQRKMTPWGKNGGVEWMGKSAIILSRNMQYIADYVNGNIKTARGTMSSKNIVNINEYYDKTFFLPLNRDGQLMLNVMTRRNWHYYLVGLFFGKDDLADYKIRQSIACDVVKNGCFILIFMDCDIGRLKRFVSIDVKPEDKGRYKIICFDFQENVVKALAPPGMDVISYNFEEVISAFFNVYNERELQGGV